jgi:LmbE family N-acetylglucosaminyl deacetylase
LLNNCFNQKKLQQCKENLVRYIYLSPHLDDAVLSCGGIILNQRKAGIPVEIWNWMCGTPPEDLPLSDLARSVHAGWELDSVKEVYATRLAEDRLAAARVDAQTRNFDLLDCIYRQADDGSFLYPDEIFVPPHVGDSKLVTEIAALLNGNLRPGDRLVVPLGIGKHPDHVIVRQAAEQTGHPLRYCADIPYTIWYPDQFAAQTAGLSAEHFSLSAEELAGWQAGIAAYASQMCPLFLTEAMMRTAIAGYCEREKGAMLFSEK